MSPGTLHRLVERLATATAVTGGLVLVGLVILVCTSIAGRTGNSVLHSDRLASLAPGLSARLLDAGVGPVDGDFELVEAGIAFAIFAFLPICQLRGGHASVDVLTRFLPVPAQRALIAFWEAVLAGVLALVAWRLHAGLLGKLSTGETTFLLQFPLWWAYAAALAGATVAALVGTYCAGARIALLATGRDSLAVPEPVAADEEAADAEKRPA